MSQDYRPSKLPCMCQLEIKTCLFYRPCTASNASVSAVSNRTNHDANNPREVGCGGSNAHSPTHPLAMAGTGKGVRNLPDPNHPSGGRGGGGVLDLLDPPTHPEGRGIPNAPPPPPPPLPQKAGVLPCITFGLAQISLLFTERPQSCPLSVLCIWIVSAFDFSLLFAVLYLFFAVLYCSKLQLNSASILA
jgi:hypothetical protein